MKKIKWFLLFVGCLFYESSVAQFVKMEPAETDSLPNLFLKESQLKLLQSAKNITAFRVHDFKTSTAGPNRLEEFKILESQTLSAEQVTQIQTVLSTPESYFFTSKIKQCLFLPQMGLQVSDGKDSLNVLLSFSCETIRFYDESGFKLINLHSEAVPFYDLFAEFFPNALALQTVEPDTLNSFIGMPFDLLECSTEKGVFNTKMVAPRPIHYILSDGYTAEQLSEKVKSECDLSIAIEKLCQLNNLTVDQLKTLKPGDAIVVGFETEN